MNLIQKLLIIITIFIATYIVFFLLKQRELILNISTKKENFAIFGNTQSSELSSLQSQLANVSITDTNADDNRPLKEYVFKSSYNSAVSGDKVSLDMIDLVLSRGCRVLDFEIIILDGQPVVTYTKDPNYQQLETDNHITLDQILLRVSTTAFAKPTPNISDPLFLHFRIKSNDKNAFKLVASVLESSGISKNNKLYTQTSKPKPVILHQRENKLNVAMQKSKFPINKEFSDFIMNLPNYMYFHANLPNKNRFADQLIELLSNPNPSPDFQSNMENMLNKYKQKRDLLTRYKDHQFSSLSGKYFDVNTNSFTNKSTNNNLLVPDSDIVNFFAFSDNFSVSNIHNDVIPHLSRDNQIDSLSSVKLKDVKGKILILLDNSNISNFNELTKCNRNDNNCYNIHDYIFSLSNSSLIQKTRFSQLVDSSNLQIKPAFNNGVSNLPKISIAVPDSFSASNMSNPDIRNLIFNFGIQMSCLKYYAIDNNLLLQEKLFNRYKSAIVPLEYIMNDLNKCDEHNEIDKCYEYD